MASSTVMVGVLGLSRLDKEDFSSHQGIGKSCLCYRFVYPGYDDYIEEHRSLLALHEFESDVVHRDHFLYWGSTTKTYDAKGSSEQVHFEVLEHTVFYQDITEQPFETKKCISSVEGYIKSAINRTLESPGKISYKNRDLICLPQEYESFVFPPGIGKHPRGYVLVIDVSESGPNFDLRLSATAKMVTHLMKHKQKFVVAATKRDAAYTTSLEKINDLARTGKFTLIECSAKSNVNVSETFEIIAAKVLGKSATALSAHAISYQDSAHKTLTNRDKARRQFRSYLLKRVTLASERLKAIECTEEYKACALLHGKFETDKMFTEHVLTVRNKEIDSYAGVIDNADLRLEFLEDFVAERTDLSLYSNYLKDLIIRICQKYSDDPSPPPPPTNAPPARKDSATYHTFVPSSPLDGPPAPLQDSREQNEDLRAAGGQDGGEDSDGQGDYTPVGDVVGDEGEDYIPVRDGVEGEGSGEGSGEDSDEYESMKRVGEGLEESSDDDHEYVNTEVIAGLALAPPAAMATKPTERVPPALQQPRQPPLPTGGNTSPTVVTSNASKDAAIHLQAATGGQPEGEGGQPEGEGGQPEGEGGLTSLPPSSLSKRGPVPKPAVKPKPKPPLRVDSLQTQGSIEVEQPTQQETKRSPDHDAVETAIADTQLHAVKKPWSDNGITGGGTSPKPRNDISKRGAALEMKGFQLRNKMVPNQVTNKIVPDQVTDKMVPDQVTNKIDPDQVTNTVVPEPATPTATEGGTLAKPRLNEIRKKVAAKYEQTVLPGAPASLATPTSPRLVSTPPATPPCSTSTAPPPVFAAPPPPHNPPFSPSPPVPRRPFAPSPIITPIFTPSIITASPMPGQDSNAKVAPPQIPISPSKCTSPPMSAGKIKVSDPMPQLTTLQFPMSSSSREPSSSEGEHTSPPPPPLPERPEDFTDQESLPAGSQSPNPKSSFKKKAYEFVTKPWTKKLSDAKELVPKPQELVAVEPTLFEPRKTFINMKSRPLPPEPAPKKEAHDSDDDVDKHDYEQVEGEVPRPKWINQPPAAGVRRARSFNAVDTDYENAEQMPTPKTPEVSSRGRRSPSPSYDYPRVMPSKPFGNSKKPVPPRRSKPAASMSPSPRHGLKAPADEIDGIHNDNYVNRGTRDDSCISDVAYDDSCISDVARDDSCIDEGTRDDSYINWDPQASSLPAAQRHSHSAEDLYMNLPLSDPTPRRPLKTIAQPSVKVAPIPPVKPRPHRAQAQDIPAVVGGTLPRAGHDPLSSSLPASASMHVLSRRTPGVATRTPGVVTRPLPPRNVMRTPNSTSNKGPPR